jgi:glutamate N-acetyltransferase/amino-acid N-acetyltransferase
MPAAAPVTGVALTTLAAGIRYQGRDDLMLMTLPAGSTIAGVLTRSATCAAPVDWCARQLPQGTARAIIVNAGNANAFTGPAGPALVHATVAAVANALDCPVEQVFIASTGVIGEPLPAAAIAAHVPALMDRQGLADWPAAAAAITTTDTFPKWHSETADVGGVPITVTGIAKGSGMIEPNMATMLGFIATDAMVAAPVLNQLLRATIEPTFGSITVDSDTSTSDTVLLAATGAAGNLARADASHPLWDGLRQALYGVSLRLAQLVVRDGEGAQKFIAVTVTGASDDASARRIAKTIANSPLVKTAIAGGDANWGRVVMAIGKAGEPIARDQLSVAMGGVTIAAAGAPVAGYDEAPVAAHLKGREIEIGVDVATGGSGAATVWTCDLTHGYIDINADYRS